MSFFFDILTKDGFVLVSERRLQTVTNGAEKNETLRKIEINPEYPSADAVKCAIVVAGDDPCKALQFFKHACDKKDEGLRSVARDFAEQWTAFFSPSVESSYADARAHLVGYQVHSLNGIDFAIPQLWYWNTLEAQNSFHYSNGYASCCTSIERFDMTSLGRDLILSLHPCCLVGTAFPVGRSYRYSGFSE